MGGQYWLGGPPFMPEAVLQSGTLLVRKGWHMWKESDMEGIISFADVIVVNYGLHYGARARQLQRLLPCCCAGHSSQHAPSAGQLDGV